MPLPQSIVAQPDMQARVARYVMKQLQLQTMRQRFQTEIGTAQIENAKRALPGQVLAQNQVNKELERQREEAEPSFLESPLGSLALTAPAGFLGGIGTNFASKLIPPPKTYVYTPTLGGKG